MYLITDTLYGCTYCIIINARYTVHDLQYMVTCCHAALRIDMQRITLLHNDEVTQDAIVVLSKVINFHLEAEPMSRVGITGIRVNSTFVI